MVPVASFMVPGASFMVPGALVPDYYHLFLSPGVSRQHPARAYSSTCWLRSRKVHREERRAQGVTRVNPASDDQNLLTIQ